MTAGLVVLPQYSGLGMRDICATHDQVSLVGPYSSDQREGRDITVEATLSPNYK